MKKWINKHEWKLWELSYLIGVVVLLLSTNIAVFIIQPDKWWIIGLSLIASTAGVTSTIVATKGLHENYWFGIPHVIAYGIIALVSSVYGDFILNILIYLPMNIYGLFFWKKMQHGKNSKPEPRHLSIWSKFGVVLILILTISVTTYVLMLMGEEWQIAIFDAGSTCTSVIGMILMMFYYREQWTAWFVVNIFSILIWVINLIINPDSLISVVYIVMWTIYLSNSIIGLVKWYK